MGHPTPTAASPLLYLALTLLGAGCEAAPPAASCASSDTTQLRVMTWNVEWFHDPREGPGDDALQFERVHQVMQTSDAHLIALQEIANPDAFRSLLGKLPGYAGVLSTYRWRQKLAALYDPERLELQGVRAVHGLDDAGRPPLELLFTRRATGAAVRLLVIHAKARAEPASLARRGRFAQGLADHLTTLPPDEDMLLAGDFNDYLEGSTVPGAASPYLPLFEAGLVPVTAPLDGADPSERSAWGGTIDHILASPGLASRLQTDSIDVRRDEWLSRFPDFTRTVSDHFPVVASFQD